MIQTTRMWLEERWWGRTGTVSEGGEEGIESRLMWNTFKALRHEDDSITRGNSSN